MTLPPAKKADCKRLVGRFFVLSARKTFQGRFNSGRPQLKFIEPDLRSSREMRLFPVRGLGDFGCLSIDIAVPPSGLFGPYPGEMAAEIWAERLVRDETLESTG
jgi:hypothetical protein